MKLVLGAAAIATLALAGCDMGKKPAAPNASDTANVGGSVAPPPATTTPAAPGAPGAGTPVASNAAICHSGDLALTHQSDDAGAGQREVVYALTNNGAAACSLTGFPTLVLIDANGQPIGSVTTVESQDGDFAANGASATVNLAAKGKAVFRIRFTGISGAGKPCVNTAKVRVTPPGNTQAMEIGDALQVCDTQVLLSPIRPS